MLQSEILAEIKRGLKEPTSGGHWDDPELLRRENIAQRQVVRKTNCIEKTSVSLLTVIGQTEYTKPSDILTLQRVFYKVLGTKLFSITKADLDIYALEGRISRPWTDDQGTPEHYYEELSLIGLYPKPAAAGDIIGLRYTVRPADLVNPGDTPFNSLFFMEDYHDLIADFVLWKCLLEDGDDRFKEYEKAFYEGLRSIKHDLKSRPDVLDTFQLVRSPSGRRRGPLPIHEG